MKIRKAHPRLSLALRAATLVVFAVALLLGLWYPVALALVWGWILRDVYAWAECLRRSRIEVPIDETRPLAVDDEGRVMVWNEGEKAWEVVG